MNTQLQWLNPEGVYHRVDELTPFLDKVVDAHPKGSFTSQGILFKFYRGEWVCWTITDEEGVLLGVAATQPATDMHYRAVLRILFLGGEKWLEWGTTVLATFEETAKTQNIYATEFVGREGFKKIMKDYEVVGLLYRKVVNKSATPVPIVDAHTLTDRR